MALGWVNVQDVIKLRLISRTINAILLPLADRGLDIIHLSNIALVNRRCKDRKSAGIRLRLLEFP